MKGNNRLILNQATMCEAVQAWITMNFMDKTIHVTSVKAETSYCSDTFEIALSEAGEKGE